MKKSSELTLIALVVGACSASWAQAQIAPSGGALLYQTYCVACHTSQIHWRERRLAQDWATLRHQVIRWQANNGLQWSDDEVDEVTRYLNATIYHFPKPAERPVG
jgi:mono/diheme cytochrome c family protein